MASFFDFFNLQDDHNLLFESVKSSVYSLLYDMYGRNK